MFYINIRLKIVFDDVTKWDIISHSKHASLVGFASWWIPNYVVTINRTVVGQYLVMWDSLHSLFLLALERWRTKCELKPSVDARTSTLPEAGSRRPQTNTRPNNPSTQKRSKFPTRRRQRRHSTQKHSKKKSEICSWRSRLTNRPCLVRTE